MFLKFLLVLYVVSSIKKIQRGNRMSSLVRTWKKDHNNSKSYL